MAQLSYDIVPRNGGWAIVVTPAPGENFPTKQAAFDAAAGIAHKLRFAGYTIRVKTSHEDAKPAPGAPKAATG